MITLADYFMNREKQYAADGEAGAELAKPRAAHRQPEVGKTAAVVPQ